MSLKVPKLLDSFLNYSSFVMDKVPAWKKLGLSVKKDVVSDDLNTTEHLEQQVVTKKVAKKLGRTSSEVNQNKEKKPPKRQKLPKAERKAPPEKDQLAYLKQFHEDKDNWKFSKQKQNWLLKNIEQIPAKYNVALRNYVDSIQGGARQRLEEQLREVVDEWNAIAKKLEEKIEAELYGNNEETEESEKSNEGSDSKSKTDEKVEEKKGPSMDYAITCKMLLDTLQDQPVELIGVEASAIDSIDIDDEAEKSSKPVETENGTQNSETDSNNELEDNLIIEEVDVEEYAGQKLDVQ